MKSLTALERVFLIWNHLTAFLRLLARHASRMVWLTTSGA